MQKEEKQYIGHGLKLFTDERVKAINNGRTLDKDISENGSFQLINVARFLLLHVQPSEAQKERTVHALTTLCPNWDKEKLKKYINKPFKERLVIAGTLISAELDKYEFINDKLGNDETLPTFKTILQQDECADNSGQYFNEQFLKHFGVSLSKFIEGIVPIDLGDTYIYLKGDYKISNEVGFWRVEELEKEV
jgi:hypothetical protein